MLIVVVVILYLVCAGSIIWFFVTDSDAVEICMLFSIILHEDDAIDFSMYVRDKY